MCRESPRYGQDHPIMRYRMLLPDMGHDSPAGSGTVRARDGRVVRFVIDSSGMTLTRRDECL